MKAKVVQRKTTTKTAIKTKNKFLFLALGFQNIDRYLSVSLCCCAVIFLNLANFALCNADDAATGENIAKYANESLLARAEESRKLSADSSSSSSSSSSSEGLVWSQFLEDYVLSQSSSSRASKDLPYLSNMNEMIGPGGHPMMMMNPNMGVGQNLQTPINYHSSAYGGKRPSNPVFITKRIGEAVELEPHMRPPLKVVSPQFRPMTNQMIQQQQQHQQQPGFLQQLFGMGGGGGGGIGGSSSTTGPSLNGQLLQQQQQPQQQPQQQQHLRPVPIQQQHHPGANSGQQTFRAVSENDLYLLGAIEKLVYRVDYLESRVRRAEQLIYYLMAGNNQKEVRDPCPANFTRISDNCYYINSHQQVNWKTANSACKALNAHLAEFERVSENEEIMAYLLNQPNYRGRDYWLGGLNPGLLWIWSNSAKPVNPNMNLTSIAQSGTTSSTTTTESNSVDVDDDDDDDDASDKGGVKKPLAGATKGDTILNNTVEIKGHGRCLRLSYNAAKHSYMYYGQECTTRHNYICEYEDKTLDNKIKKITRDLKLFD